MQVEALLAGAMHQVLLHLLKNMKFFSDQGDSIIAQVVMLQGHISYHLGFKGDT